MIATLQVQAGEATVTVRELTVGEVRAWAVEREAVTETDAVGELVAPDCSLDDIGRMSDATPEMLESLTAAQLGAVVEACKKLNPHFFRIRAALTGAAHVLAEETRRALSSTTA